MIAALFKRVFNVFINSVDDDCFTFDSVKLHLLTTLSDFTEWTLDDREVLRDQVAWVKIVCAAIAAFLKHDLYLLSHACFGNQRHCPGCVLGDEIHSHLFDSMPHHDKHTEITMRADAP